MVSIPKPASTVVLMDHQRNVYLTKRPRTMKFLGGYYVFPGGSVEKEDYNTPLQYIRSWKMARNVGFAHYIAAARELFEEVGIFLGHKENGLELQFTKNTVSEYRSQLINREISFLELLKKENLQLNFKHLTYFGHRVTPKTSNIRFDTRFFIAKLPRGQKPNPECLEIDEAVWMDPKDALASYSIGKMRMAHPTLESLQTILRYRAGEELMMPAQQRTLK